MSEDRVTSATQPVWDPNRMRFVQVPRPAAAAGALAPTSSVEEAPPSVNQLAPSLVPNVGPTPVHALAPDKTVKATTVGLDRAISSGAVPSGPSSTSYPPGYEPPVAAGTGTYEFLRNQRAPFKKELENPALMKKAAAIIETEDAGNGVPVVESLFNRAAFKGSSVESMMTPAFYSPMRSDLFSKALSRLDANPKLMDQRAAEINYALNGSNMIRGYTDQGSPGAPNYEEGGVGITFSNRERYNDWNGYNEGIRGNSKQFRLQQQTQLGDPDKPGSQYYMEAPGPSVPVAPYTAGAPGTQAGPGIGPGAVAQPQGDPSAGGAALASALQQQNTQQMAQMQQQEQRQRTLMALSMMGAMNKGVTFHPIQYDPWANVPQIGSASMKLPPVAPPYQVGHVGYRTLGSEQAGGVMGQLMGLGEGHVYGSALPRVLPQD